MKMSKKKEQQFEADIEEALSTSRKNIKIRITAMLDADVLDALREMAKETGVGYQTLLNMKLRESILGEAIVDKNVIELITEKLKKLEKKVERLSKRA